MFVTVICANDSMELAFLPGTPFNAIESHKRKIKRKMDKRYPDRNVYVHIHEVELLEVTDETNAT